MARYKDIFGFDELSKDFKKMEKKYPNAADAMLMAQGKAAQKRTKQLTPTYKGSIPPSKAGSLKPGRLKRSWSLKKVKLYKNGTVRVVRIQSAAPHAHLIEDGHEIIRGGKTWVKNKRGKGKVNLNRVQRAARGITSHGRTEGRHMLEQSVTEAQKRFDRDAQKLLDKLTKDVEI